MSRHATSPSEAAGAADTALGTERAVALHRTMLVIRRAEERLAQLFADGEVPGFIHLSIGQEGIAAGIGAALSPTDTIASTHRGHGHAIAKGVPLPGFFAEVMGRDTGLCRGRGGSMHVADMSVGMLGANGIVGAGIPLALGSAIAHDTRGTGAIAVAFFGDGALAEGVLHESLNMAALWRLPMLFVNENNGWSEFSPAAEQFRARVTDLAGAFGIEARTVDGNDVAAVFSAAEEMTARLRAGEGPLVLECVATRVSGHFEGDPQKYRPQDDIDPARDPISISRAALLARGLTEGRLDALATEVEAEVDEAIAAARKGAPADFAAAARDVYTGRAAFATIERERLTWAWFAPVMLGRLIASPLRERFDLSSLKWAIGGGEKTPEARIHAFRDLFPNGRYIDGYGLTETCSADTLMEAGREIEKIGTTGRALPHCEVTIRDDDGNPLPPGAVGEICVRGPNVTKGYWKDPEKTAASFHAGGWFRSGDVGTMDAEGFLTITDRKKDMILSGGENIASCEVERVIFRMAEVEDAAVIGVPDEDWGERVVAVVVPRAGADLTL